MQPPSATHICGDLHDVALQNNTQVPPTASHCEMSEVLVVVICDDVDGVSLLNDGGGVSTRAYIITAVTESNTKANVNQI